MAKNLRIISINFPFKNPAVRQANSLATREALFDFDVVVIRPYLLAGLPAGRLLVEWRVLQKAKHEMEAKREDLQRLLSQGGLLVVILDALQELGFTPSGYTSMGEIHTVTNYDFVNDRCHVCIRNGHGNRVDYLNPSETFTTVIKNSSVEWTAFITGRLEYPFDDMKFLARNGAGSFVAGSIGNFVVLPNFKELDEEEFFQACHDYRYKREGMPQPDWLQQVSLPKLGDAEAQISAVQKEIARLEELLGQFAKKRDGLFAYKKLLYEKGKVQLEPIVRTALDDLGFVTTPAEMIPGTAFEIDGRTTKGSTPGILEVKGSKKQVSLDEFSPFAIKILTDFEAKKLHSKGLFVANGLCETLPKERSGPEVFSPHVLEAARTHSVALVNSVQLYWAICELLSGKLTDTEAVRETILAGNGYVDLRQFFRDSPFL